ncbi:MAG: hypothetical protein GX198_06010 [Epulopiscium sp.]|nr:hypothetical protein [Candidatus Epulonipiscium sp.]
MQVLMKRILLLPRKQYCSWIALNIYFLLLQWSDITNLLGFAFLINFVINVTIREYDHKNSSAKLINSLPVTRKEIVRSTFLLTLLTLPVCYAFNYLLYLIFSSAGIRFNIGNLRQNMVIAFIGLMIHSLWILLSFMIEKSLPLYFLIGFFVPLFMFNAEWGIIKDFLSHQLIPLGIVFILWVSFSYFLSLRIYLKKEL